MAVTTQPQPEKENERVLYRNLWLVSNQFQIYVDWKSNMATNTGRI
jgi:hypothetical protein